MSPKRVVICVLFSLLCNTGFAGTLINSVTTPLNTYDAGAIIPIYIRAASDVVGGTATLQMTSPYGVIIKPLMTLDLLNGQYLHRWYSEGYLPGDYIIDATFTAPNGQQDFRAHALTIKLNSVHDFVIPVDVNPKEVRPGDKVDLSVVALASFLMSPGMIANVSFSVSLGATMAMPYTPLHNGVFTFLTPNLPPGEYPINLVIGPSPQHKVPARQKLKVRRSKDQPGSWSASWDLKLHQSSPEEVSQIVIEAITTGEDAHFVRTNLDFSKYDGRRFTSTDIHKVPLFPRGDHKYALTFPTEGFEDGTRCSATIEYLLPDGELLNHPSSRSVYLVNAKSDPPSICRRNLALLQAAKFAWALDHKVWLPRCFEVEELDWGQTPDLSDLKDYLSPLPVCPEEGTYILNSLDALPLCSVGDHGTGRATHWTQEDDHILSRWGNQAIFGQFERINGRKCSENLVRMERAKTAWAYASNATDNYAPVSSYLMQYLSCNAIPVCPSVGYYGYGTTGTSMTPSPATCSASVGPGHHALDVQSVVSLEQEQAMRRADQLFSAGAHLRAIQRAKIQWARYNGGKGSDYPDVNDLLPYLPGYRLPTPPHDTYYDSGTVDELPELEGEYFYRELDSKELLEPGMSLSTPPFDPVMPDSVGPVITNLSTHTRLLTDKQVLDVTAEVCDIGAGNSNIHSARISLFLRYNNSIIGEATATDGAFDSPREQVTASIDMHDPQAKDSFYKPNFTVFADDSAGNTGILETTYFDVTIRSTTPILILQPDGVADLVTGSTYQITWADADDVDLPIALCYMNSAERYRYGDMTFLNTKDQYPKGLTVRDPRNAYTWDISALNSGVYYIGAYITKQDYGTPKLSLGPITIRRDDPTPLPTPTEIVTPTPTDTPAPTATPSPTPLTVPTCPPNPDLNSDGIIDATDLMLFSGYWHETPYMMK